MSYPNMGYCKWENTAAAMEQCVEAEMDFQYPEELNDYETLGMGRCLRAAYAMLEAAPRDMLDQMDIRLENLA